MDDWELALRPLLLAAAEGDADDAAVVVGEGGRGLVVTRSGEIKSA